MPSSAISSSSAGRLRQEPSIREEFLRIAKSSATNAGKCNFATFVTSSFGKS